MTKTEAAATQAAAIPAKAATPAEGAAEVVKPVTPRPPEARVASPVRGASRARAAHRAPREQAPLVTPQPAVRAPPELAAEERVALLAPLVQ